MFASKVVPAGSIWTTRRTSFQNARSFRFVLCADIDSIQLEMKSKSYYCVEGVSGNNGDNDDDNDDDNDNTGDISSQLATRLSRGRTRGRLMAQRSQQMLLPPVTTTICTNKFRQAVTAFGRTPTSSEKKTLCEKVTGCTFVVDESACQAA